MRKSQASFGFMFGLGTIFFVFLIVFVFMLDTNNELSDTKDDANKRSTCLLISSLVTSALVGGDGTIIDVYVNYKINVTTIGADTTGLNVEDTYCLLAVESVPNAKLSKGYIRIQNNNNYIDMQNV
ncbi:MAG: hypothetical protein U9O94_01050 [Nanoarchaeota archaeon]|nr:hypothetical protein [Nanoarchaeota archaeon]